MLTRGSVTNVLIKRYICEKEIQLFLDQEFCSKETHCVLTKRLYWVLAERFYCVNKRLCDKCVLTKSYICEKVIQLFLDQEFCSKETHCVLTNRLYWVLAERFYYVNKRLCDKCILIKKYLWKKSQLFLDQEFCSKETHCVLTKRL